MQPPGGGPPGDKRHPLPPPWGHPPREPTSVTPPAKSPAPAPAPPPPTTAATVAATAPPPPPTPAATVAAAAGAPKPKPAPRTTLTGLPAVRPPPDADPAAVAAPVPVAVSQAVTAPGPSVAVPTPMPTTITAPGPAPGPTPATPTITASGLASGAIAEPARLPKPPQPGQPYPSTSAAHPAQPSGYPLPPPPPPQSATGSPPPTTAAPPLPAYPPPPGVHPPTPLPLMAPPEPIAPSLAPDRGVIELLKISTKRAFRVRLDPAEVLPQERAALAVARITDPEAQAFLAWRRSVLLVVASALGLLAILQLVEVIQMAGQELGRGTKTPGSITALRAIPLLATAGFAVLAWMQLRHWTAWQKQRRLLALGLAGFVAAPFVVYLMPLGELYAEGLGDALGSYTALLGAMAFGPAAIALMPGAIRASLVSKLLFPGSAAPGWLIVIAAPIGALVTYLVLVVPYHVTGSGWLFLAIGGLIAGHALLARAGYALTRPQTDEHAAATVKQVRIPALAALVGGGLFVAIAFFAIRDDLELRTVSVVNLLLAAGITLLALTLVATDTLLAVMDRARGDLAARTLADDAQDQLAAFVQASSAQPPL